MGAVEKALVASEVPVVYYPVFTADCTHFMEQINSLKFVTVTHTGIKCSAGEKFLVTTILRKTTVK